MTLPPSLKSAMTPFPYAVSPDASLEEATKLMEEHDVRHLPVVKDHQIVGIIAEHDILLTRSRAGPRKKKLRVDDCYQTDVYVVDLNEPIDNVLITMAERHIGSTIVTRRGRLAGVFTAMDACRCFGEYLADNFPHGGGDDAA
jgi:acetoin utilization protein AcuB